MTASLFPDLAPPQTPKTDRTRYIRRVQAAVIQLAMRNSEVNADAVHRLVEAPEGISPNVMGVAFTGLVSAGLIEPVRFERSTRVQRHGNVFRVWRIANYGSASAYLEALRKTGDAHELV